MGLDENPQGKQKIKGSLEGIEYMPDEEGRLQGKYVKTISYNNYYDLQVEYWEKALKDNLPRVLSGEISPIALYSLILDLTPKEVALRMGLRKGAVRRHMTGKGFQKVSVRLLSRYAELFGVPVAALFCFVTPELGALDITVEQTEDGLVSLLKPGREENEWNFLQAPTRRSL